MKNIETPLTWGLGVLAIVLIVLSSLNTTSTDFNISNVNSDVNDGFNLNHDHQTQNESSFNIKEPNMGMAAMAADLEIISDLAVDSLEGIIIFENDELKDIIMIADEDSSDE